MYNLSQDIDEVADYLLKQAYDLVLKDRSTEEQVFRALVSEWEDPFEVSLKALFTKQKREVLKKLSGKIYGLHIRKRENKDLSDFYTFDMQPWIDQFAKAIKKHITKIFERNGKRVFNTLPIPEKSFNTKLNDSVIGEITFSMEYPEVAEFLDTYSIKLSTELNTVSDAILREQILEGFAAGEDMGQIRKRVTATFSKFSNVRALMIASTETVRAANMGALSAYKQSKVVASKEWLTAQDEKVCPFCNEMDAIVKDLNEAFLPLGGIVEGTGSTGDTGVMINNYQDVDVPPLHTRCRCTLLPVIKEL